MATGSHFGVFRPSGPIRQKDLEEYFWLRRRYMEKRLWVKRLLRHGASVEPGVHTALIVGDRLRVL